MKFKVSAVVLLWPRLKITFVLFCSSVMRHLRSETIKWAISENKVLIFQKITSYTVVNNMWGLNDTHVAARGTRQREKGNRRGWGGGTGLKLGLNAGTETKEKLFKIFLKIILSFFLFFLMNLIKPTRNDYSQIGL